MFRNIVKKINDYNEKWTSRMVGRKVKIEKGQVPLIMLGALIALYLYPKQEFTQAADYLPSLYVLLISALVTASMIKNDV